MAYANCRDWNVALMVLHPDPDENARREAACMSHIALRAALGGVGATECPFKDLGVEPLPRHWFGADLSRKCSYAVHHFSESTRELDVFVPAQIEVSRSSTCKPFWPGSKAARASHERTKAKAQKLRDPMGHAPLGDDAIDIRVVEDFGPPLAGYEADPSGWPPEHEGGCGGDDPAEGWGAAIFEAMAKADELEDSFDVMCLSLRFVFY